MRTPESLLRDRKVHGYLFVLFAALLSWPVLNIVESNGSGLPMFSYLFFCWLAIIIVLFAIGRSHRNDAGR